MVKYWRLYASNLDLLCHTFNNPNYTIVIMQTAEKCQQVKCGIIPHLYSKI